MEVFDADEAMLQKEYFLKCRVNIKAISYDDVQSKGTTKRTEDMAFLLPIDNTERTKFFIAWLPEEEKEHFELVAIAGHPISGPIRLSIHRRDHRQNDHYLFVMTKSAEEALKALNGKEIAITIQPKSNDSLGDMAKDYALGDNKAKEKVVELPKGI